MNNLKRILVTGASSGIGAALARHYAGRNVHLLLAGRDEYRLESVAADCREKGAVADVKIIDVTDEAAMRRWIVQEDETAPLDLVIANAGISGGTGGGAGVMGETPEQARRIFAVNLTGVQNTIDPVLPRMMARGAGQVALMSSLASFSGWPGAPAYSASKGAVRMYGEALRPKAAAYGVRVNVICPGFIDTPMTAVNNYKMPFMMSAEKSARIIARGLERNLPRIAFPMGTYLFAGFFGLLPPFLGQRLLSRMPEKPASSSS